MPNSNIFSSNKYVCLYSLCNRQIQIKKVKVENTRENTHNNSTIRWLNWSIISNENVPPQNQTQKVYNRRAIDTDCTDSNVLYVN